jgi:translation initiation factor 2A
LHLLLTDGQTFTVPFGSNEGPLHDAKWSPQGADFCVIQGHQPAKITLFNAANCQAVRDFGNAARNTIEFSPHGRFVVFGGFRGLAGEMDFWEKNKFKLLGTAQDIHMPGSFHWTPDSRTFITAALFPRRRVDEGFKVWTYYGEMLYEVKMEKLRQVAVRPALPGAFPNRPISPRLKDRKIQQEIASKMEAAKPKAYVPPHLRKKGASAPSDIVKQSRDISGPKKITQAKAALTSEDKAASAAKTAEKNKKRRERMKQKKEAEETKKSQEDEEKKAQIQREQAAKLEGMSESDVIQKKIKKLQKLQRQVVKLREQKASGETMDTSQLEKIESNSNIEQDISKLEDQLAKL